MKYLLCEECGGLRVVDVVDEDLGVPERALAFLTEATFWCAVAVALYLVVSVVAAGWHWCLEPREVR